MQGPSVVGRISGGAGRIRSSAVLERGRGGGRQSKGEGGKVEDKKGQ